MECVVTDGICRNFPPNFKWEFALFICKFSQKYNKILRTGDIKQHAPLLACINDTTVVVHAFRVLVVVKVIVYF